MAWQGVGVRFFDDAMSAPRFGLDHTTLQVDQAPDEVLAIGDGPN
jgi:hypothetical protein